MVIAEFWPEFPCSFADDFDVAANRVEEERFGNVAALPEGPAHDEFPTAILNVPEEGVRVFGWHDRLQGDGFGQHALAEVAKAAGRHYVDSGVEQVLDVGDKTGQVEKGPAVVHVY